MDLETYNLLGEILNADPRALAVLDLTDPDLLPKIRTARETFRNAGTPVPGRVTDIIRRPTTYYTSADHAGTDSPWSVYVKQYLHADHDEPVDGSQQLVSSWPTEAEADAEATRLQKTANA